MILLCVCPPTKRDWTQEQIDYEVKTLRKKNLLKKPDQDRNEENLKDLYDRGGLTSTVVWVYLRDAGGSIYVAAQMMSCWLFLNTVCIIWTGLTVVLVCTPT